MQAVEGFQFVRAESRKDRYHTYATNTRWKFVRFAAVQRSAVGLAAAASPRVRA